MVEVLGVPLSLILLLAGTGLVVAEALAPGAHFIVIGVALLVAGAVGLALGGILGAFTPLVLALVVLLAGAATFRFYRDLGVRNRVSGGQTSDSDSLRGQTGRVTERVSRDGGEVKLDNGGFNPYYRARSMDGDIEVGTEVIVIDPGGGNVLTVASLSGVDDIDRELERGRRQLQRDDEETEAA
ncbi:NfeD family protein [Halorarius litoreus]|uniref:NfeD family protein n=1 Tax=Halorarius litoreus TaxID=2962676 RepID=UPI0020CBB2AE|nr:NfeD family protein [Halorarius litoreus]